MARKIKIEAKDADVPLSAMIDVVFLLLIYFIVSQKPVVEDCLLDINLPAPGAPSASNKPPGPLLTIDVSKLNMPDSNNYYYVNKRRMHIKDLTSYLHSIAEADKETTVIIACDPNARHKKLIRLLDICNRFGLSKLNLINDDGVYFVPEKPVLRK